VGAVHPRKNVARLVDAFTEFRNNNHEDYALLIAGRLSWNFADVQQAIERSPYKRDIIVTGYVTEHVLSRITASAFALCYISLYEGFGLPVAEAMACDVPVIVSKDSAHAEVAGEAGMQVDPTDIRDVADMMQKVVTDTALRNEMVARGRKRNALFSWDTAAKQTYDVLIRMKSK
jgi:glycosyltransferase involved in cell wall biosynthesis